MPPGARPVQPGNGSMLRPPMQMSQTQAIAQSGKAAIDQRRQAASYDQTGKAQALKDLYNQINTQGSGYSAQAAPTDQFQQWMNQRGFGNQNYPVTFGRTDKGAYSGFKTEGELKSAILGASEIARQKDMQQAAQLKADMESRLGKLDTSFGQSAAEPVGANVAALAGLGSRRAAEGQTFGGITGHAFSLGGQKQAALSANDQAVRLADVQGQRTGDYLNQLNDWYAKQAEPYVSGLETANQITETPTRQYATVAGAGYGVDPNLIAGWFPMASEVTDAANQRNLQSLHSTGLPYDETQQVLRQMDTQAQQQASQSQADQQVQMSNDIYGITSYTGESLASAAQLPIDAVHQIVTDPFYSATVNTVETVKAQAEADHPGNTQADQDAIQAAVDDAIQASVDDQATVDPTTASALDRILRAQFGA